MYWRDGVPVGKFLKGSRCEAYHVWLERDAAQAPGQGNRTRQKSSKIPTGQKAP